MRNLILISLVIFSGCASSTLNSVCAHVNGNEMTVPYIGGKGNADIFMCRMTCFGSKCPVPDYAALQIMTSDYLKTSRDKISTVGPGTITFIPESK